MEKIKSKFEIMTVHAKLRVPTINIEDFVSIESLIEQRMSELSTELGGYCVSTGSNSKSKRKSKGLK